MSRDPKTQIETFIQLNKLTPKSEIDIDLQQKFENLFKEQNLPINIDWRHNSASKKIQYAPNQLVAK